MPEEEVVEQPQVVEAPVVEGGEGGEDSEELILGRFKSQDDLTKSYQELEKKFTQLAQENSTFRKSQQEDQIRQMFPPQQAQVSQDQQEDYNQQFWTNPVDTMSTKIEQLLDSKLDFVYNQNYDAQKAAFASDPVFQQYEQQIDYIAKDQYPELRKQPGIVGQLYKMVRGLTFDEEAFKRKTIEEYEKNRAAGANNGIEGASPSPSSIPASQKVDLSDAEKRTATQFFPDLKPEEAWQKYANAKVKMKGVANG